MLAFGRRSTKIAEPLILCHYQIVESVVSPRATAPYQIETKIATRAPVTLWFIVFGGFGSNRRSLQQRITWVNEPTASLICKKDSARVCFTISTGLNSGCCPGINNLPYKNKDRSSVRGSGRDMEGRNTLMKFWTLRPG